MNDAITTATAAHELRMRQLQDQVDGMERQLAEILERNKDEELRMRKEKSRAEVVVAGKIAQYDEDMAQRKVQLEELTTAYKAESAEYSVLKVYYDQVTKNKINKKINKFKKMKTFFFFFFFLNKKIIIRYFFNAENVIFLFLFYFYFNFIYLFYLLFTLLAECY